VRVILGTPVGARPMPWLHYRVPAVMVNAYELLRRGVRGGVKGVLGYDGEVWVDSGGYQFMRRGVVPRIDDVVRVYEESWDARYYLSLDYPPLPTDDEAVLRAKLKATLRSYEVLRRRFDNVVPVVHYHWSGGCVEWVLDRNPEVIAIGALVPYVLVSRGVPGRSRFRAMEFIAKVRGVFRGRIHVLGLGSPVLNPILESLGVDSTDTSTWRVKAAYGKVILPGGGERHVSGREISFGRGELRGEEFGLLLDFLRRTGFPLLHRIGELGSSFEYRALVNAWVVLNSREPPRSRQFRRILEEVVGRAYSEATVHE